MKIPVFQLKKPWPWSYQKGWTTTYPIIWYSDYKATGRNLAHEMIHVKQQLYMLVIPWWILYIFGPLPISFNPFRYRMEWEAYKYGSEMPDWEIEYELNSSYYGGLSAKLHKWVLKIPPRLI